MKKNWQKFILFLVLEFLILVSPTIILAADTTGQQQTSGMDLGKWKDNLNNAIEGTGYTKTNTDKLEVIIGKIINAVLGLLGVVFLCYMIYGGYLWLTAGGNEERIKKAKNILTNSTIGLAIVLAAYAITYFVVEKLIGATSYVG